MSKTQILEASGITRKGKHLLIVGDDTPGSYWKVKLSKDQLGGKQKVIPIKTGKQKRLRGAHLATDLEAIEQLADDRIVVLSERQHALIGKVSKNQYGIIAEYDARQ